jgi:3-hexulose-6-phosphate synthase/6-phospho-3-hexuloisomerase
MSSALLARCRAIATSTWSDALDQFQLHGVIQGLVLRTGSGPIAGTAVTVRESVGGLGSYPPTAFTPGAFLDVVAPDTVLVIDLGGAAVSSCGGLVAQAAVQRGTVGLIIDGGCRDVAEVRESGLWLSSRHVTPVSGRGRVRIDAINAPVTIGGTRVHPGDYVIGDETGIVCVPADRVPDLLPIAEQLAAKDAQFASALREGHTFTAAAAQVQHV